LVWKVWKKNDPRRPKPVNPIEKPSKPKPKPPIPTPKPPSVHPVVNHDA